MRYDGYGDLDDKPLLDGDEAFAGLITADEPDALAPGMLSKGINIRMSRGSIDTRPTLKALLDSTQNQELLDEGAFDAVRFSQENDADDSVLIAGKTKAFLFKDETLTDVAYPADIYENILIDKSIGTGFLLNTTVATMLFPDPSPHLDIQLDVTELGRQPLRLRKNADGTYEFKYHKQETIIQAFAPVGDEISFETDGMSTLVEGELINVYRSGESPYKVSSVEDRVVKAIPSDTDTRPTWTANATVTNAFVYSMEDQCPSASFATWAGNRVIVPAGNDDIFVSSPLSTHDFPDFTRLTIGSGDSGNITALEPMADDSLVVFKHHSVYLVSGIFAMRTADEGGTLAITRISDQLGCLNHNAVQVVGQEIMFFNKQGLYGLTLNTKGAGSVGLPPQAVRITDLALSRDIEDLLDENYNFDKVSLEFFKGRIYMILSVNNSLSNRDAQTDTHVYVYNTLLSRFESLDKYDGAGWKFLTINVGSPKLIMFHLNHGLLDMEGSPDANDKYIQQDTPLETEFITRGYRCKTFSQKHYKMAMFTINRISSTNADELRTDVLYEAPTSQTNEFVRDSYDASLGQYIHNTGVQHYRDRLHNQAETARFRLKSKGLLYNFKRVAIEATESARNIIDFKT